MGRTCPLSLILAAAPTHGRIVGPQESSALGSVLKHIEPNTGTSTRWGLGQSGKRAPELGETQVGTLVLGFEEGVRS